MWLLSRILNSFVRRGELIVIDHDGTRHCFGTPHDELNSVSIRLKGRTTSFHILRDPALGAGEAWMDGRLEMERGEILDLLRLIRRNARWEEGGEGICRSRDSLLARLDRFNWRRRSRRNAAHHYDLGNELYECFLDSDMQYSCAYFRSPDNTLERAQEDKKAHIAAKLRLAPGQRVLDIGCGWGGLAIYLSRVADVDVVGITLSEEQLQAARRRADEAGVAGRVRFALMDYRDVEGPFDRIVSVGMFEHVGPPFYRTFFRKCREVMRDDGVMLLHTIGRMGGPGSTDRFTAKYIFPGGYIPALSEILRASEKERVIVADCETLRLHYYHTIWHWYDRTKANHAKIVRLFDERFYRLWLFYLAGAMTAFADGSLVNYQLQYIRNRRALPIIRDHIAESENELREAAACAAERDARTNESCAGR